MKRLGRPPLPFGFMGRWSWGLGNQPIALVKFKPILKPPCDQLSILSAQETARGSFKITCLGPTSDPLNQNLLGSCSHQELRKAHPKIFSLFLQGGRKFPSCSNSPAKPREAYQPCEVPFYCKSYSPVTFNPQNWVSGTLGKQGPCLPLKVSLFIYGMYLPLREHKDLLRGGCNRVVG